MTSDKKKEEDGRKVGGVHVNAQLNYSTWHVAVCDSPLNNLPSITLMTMVERSPLRFARYYIFNVEC